MSHKYRVSIGRESPRPASRGITTQLEPRRISRDPSSRKSDFCGKNSGFAARREMPAFLYSRQGISSPANAEGIPEYFLCAYKSMWLPGIRQKGAAGLSADIPARQVWPHGQTFPKSAARLAANRMVHPPARRCAATAFFRREKGSKTRRSPAANGMRPAAPPTPPNRWSKTPSSSCSRGAQISFFPLTSAAVRSRRRPAYLQ